jgi:hypothetical protein
MPKPYLKSWLFILTGCFLAWSMDSRGPAKRDAPRIIEKIYFLIHPLLYEPKASDPAASARAQKYIDYERKIAPRWFNKIAGMRNNEALVVGAPGCPKNLQDFVGEHLGPRGLIIKDAIVTRPELWNDLSPEAKEGLGHDLLAMYWKNGFEWASDPLGQPIIARGWAEHVKRTFHERGLTFDPKTVQTEGWGESFEGCVANYGRYLGTYLGLGKPIEDNFEMTVPDAPFLLTAKFLERIPLERAVSLYFWEGQDGRPIALFLNLQSDIGAPTLYAQLPAESVKVEVRSRMNRPMWPKAEGHAQVKDGTAVWEVHRQEKGSTVTEAGGRLKIPIPTPLVLDAAYIFGDGVPFAEFRAALKNAAIMEER